MKNTSRAGGSVFRKKGFFIALYSCLGVVAVLAMVMTFSNRHTGQDTDYNQLAAPVGADQVDSYLAAFDEEAWFRPRQTDPPMETQPEPTPRPTTPPTTPPPTLPPTPPPTTAPAPPEPTQAAAPAMPPPQIITFDPFTAYDRMPWPLYGETVMPFSITSLIYDPTLDQFRTNDNIHIAAEEGTPVRAGADGVVIAMGRSARHGNYVTIDHGNGWLATFGQLMDDPPVVMGELIRTGQVIGGVGQPSIFGSAHGTHLHLRIMQDDVAVNPYYVLAERE